MNNRVTETQKEIAKYLYELVNAFGGIAVPARLEKFVIEAGAAIGLRVRSCFPNPEAHTIVLYLA